jgi:hypothetical protein
MKCATCDWIISPTDSSADTTIGEICTCCAFDLLRWRKWPAEKPEKSGRYLVLTDGSTDVGDHVSYYSMSAGWATKDAGIAHWRPIGPLPKESE